MRRGRRALAALGTVLVLFVVADVGLRLVAQRVLAGRLAEELRLSERPEVDLGGFPFLLSLARQRVGSARVEVRDATVGGLPVTRLRLDLEGLRFSLGQGLVRAARGSGELEVDEAGAAALLETAGTAARVTFLGPEVRFQGPVDVNGVPVEVTALGELRLVEGELSFEPTSVEAAGGPNVPAGFVSFRIPLPSAIPGARYERLRVLPGRLVMDLVLRDSILRVA